MLAAHSPTPLQDGQKRLVQVGPEPSNGPKGRTFRCPRLASARDSEAARGSGATAGPQPAALGQSERALEGSLPRNHSLLEFLRIRAAKTHKGKATIFQNSRSPAHPAASQGIRAGGRMHRPVERQGNENGAIFDRNTTPPRLSRRLSRATSPALPHLHRNGYKLRSVRSKTLLWCEAPPGWGARLRQGPWALTPATRPACRSDPSPAPARDPPSARGPRRPAHHTTPLAAEPGRPATAQPAARRKQKGVSECVHSAARRAVPTSPRPLRAPVPGRTHLRRAAAAAAATAAPRCRPSPSPSPVHAGAAARGTVAWAGGLGGGVRRSAGLPHALPGRGGRDEHYGRKASGRGLHGTLRSCAPGSGRGA